MATFALITDPHVTVPNPQTGWMLREPVPHEPTMYLHSVELLEQAIAEINAMPEIDFVLCAGDLTKDSEPYNHDAVRDLLSRFRKPVYCVPGNHDQPRPPHLRPTALLDPDVRPLTTEELPPLYCDFGFQRGDVLAFSCDPTPDVHLVALCSAKPNDDAGYIPERTLAWLEDDLARQRDPARQVIVLLHHSIIEHVPNERVDPTFSWFHVENSDALKAILRRHGVRITLSGHLHIQDIKEEAGLYNIVTASLAGYPHAYRVFSLEDGALHIRSRRLASIPSIPNLQEYSRAYTSETFVQIIADSLRKAPFQLPEEQAIETARRLRDWWPRLAEGDARFAYTAEDLGSAALAAYVNSFSDVDPPDNECVLPL
ncbi:MAG: metallophosphoesterase [Candidatus Binatia bacterium]|nr:metallophosphoesterase [Candidatus Binatia bacterium]